MNTNKSMSMHDEIARVAYGLYEKRGYANGNDFADWIEAEKIVKNKQGKAGWGEGKSIKQAFQSKTSKKNH